MSSIEHTYTLTEYLTGALPARLGDAMSDQVILLSSLAITGSIKAGSTAIAGLTLSVIIGAPLLGTLLDRSSRHPGKILAITMGLYAVGVAALSFSLGHVPIWATVGIALLTGLFMPAISGGWSSRLKSFIPHKHLAQAGTIDAMTFNIAGLVGPAIAGIIAIVFGAPWAIAVLVAVFLAALPAAWTLPRDKTHIAHRTNFTKEFVRGLSTIRENKKLLRAVSVTAVCYMGIGMLWVLFPLLGKEALGKAGYGGILSSLVSLGALAATIIYAKKIRENPPDKVIFYASFVFAISFLFLYFVASSFLAFGAMLMIGVADGPLLAAAIAIKNREVPDDLRSEVFTTSEGIRVTSAAIGVGVAGLLASHSLKSAILVAGAIEVGATSLYLLYSLKRTRVGALAIKPLEP